MVLGLRTLLQPVEAAVSRSALRERQMRVLTEQDAKEFVKAVATPAWLSPGLRASRQLNSGTDNQGRASLLDAESNVLALSEWVMNNLTEAERREMRARALTEWVILGDLKAQPREFLL